MKKMNRQKVLILGARGLVGHVLFNNIARNTHFDCFGTVRGKNPNDTNFLHSSGAILPVDDLQNRGELEDILVSTKPHIIINCLSLAKTDSISRNALRALFVNVPHALSEIAATLSARVINISSDAVFSGTKGDQYNELNSTDATEPYGLAKKDGEVCAPHILNLRASFVGYDPFKRRGLLEWFLAQEVCSLYSNYIFSGLPVPKFAEIIQDFVLNNSELCGTYHIGSTPISKLECLGLIAKTVNHRVKINRDESVVINRSLDTKKFASATGYEAQSWMEIQDYLCSTVKQY